MSRPPVVLPARSPTGATLVDTRTLLSYVGTTRVVLLNDEAIDTSSVFSAFPSMSTPRYLFLEGGVSHPLATLLRVPPKGLYTEV